MSAPPPYKDVQEFQFKLLCRLKLFPLGNTINLDKPVKLVTAASKYGLIFAGCPTGVQCIVTSHIFNIQESRPNNRGNITEYPRRELLLGCQPTHLDVSSDNEMLAVVFPFQDCPIAHIYNVASFGSQNLIRHFELRLSNTPGVTVFNTQWNPGVANMFSVVLSDGSVTVYEFKDSAFSINSLPPSVNATCLCWSPKGKQVVIGSNNGSLSQYKPDLKPVKTFPPPQITNNPQSVVSVHWLSSFQFAAVYKDVANPSLKPVLVIVNVPKAAPVSYINYEDFCFGAENQRPEYYFIHQQIWNVLLVGCGNSMELGVLGQVGDTPVWEQWRQDEANRAELPLNDSRQDVFNVGITFDTSPRDKIPIGESKFLDPMPVIHMLSHEGVLCIFHTVNLLSNAPNLCTPPQQLPDQSGLNLFIVPKVEAQQKPAEPPKLEPAVAPQLMSSALGFSQPAATTQPQSLLSAFSLSPGQPPQTSQPLLFAPTTSTPQANIFSSFSLPKTTMNFAPQASLPFSATTTAPTSAQQFTFFPFPLSTSTTAQPAAPSLFTGLKTTQAPGLLPTPSTAQAVASSAPPLTGLFSTSPSPGLCTTTFPQQPKVTATASPSIGTEGSPSSTLSSLSTLTSMTSQFTVPSVKQMAPTTFGSLLASPTSVSNQQTPIKSQEPPTLGISDISPVTSSSKKLEEVIEEKVTKIEEVVKEEEETKEEEPEPDDWAYKNALHFEMKNFVEDLSELEKHLKVLNCTIGEESQKKDLKVQTDNLEEFGKDLKETTASQESEVSALRGTLMETLSWFENIKNKHSQLTDNRYSSMRDSDKLDPISEKHVKNIDQNLSDLESQVKQLNATLELLWKQQRGNTMMKQGLEIPSLETIFQSIVAHQNILNRQKALLCALENEIAVRKSKMQQYWPQRKKARGKFNNVETELSTLAEKLLRTNLGDTEDPNKTLKEATNKYMVLANSQKPLSSKQEAALLNWHKKHKVINTKVIKRPVISKEILNSSIRLSDHSINYDEGKVPNGVITPQKTPKGIHQIKTPPPSTASLKLDNGSNVFSIKKTSTPIIQTTSPSSISKSSFQQPKSLFTINTQSKTTTSQLTQGVGMIPPSEGTKNTLQNKHADITPDLGKTTTSSHEKPVQSFQIKNIFPGSGQPNFKVNQDLQSNVTTTKTLISSSTVSDSSPAFKIDNPIDISKTVFTTPKPVEKKDKIQDQSVKIDSGVGMTKDQAPFSTNLFGGPTFNFTGSVFSKPSQTTSSPSSGLPFAAIATTSQILQTTSTFSDRVNWSQSEVTTTTPSTKVETSPISPSNTPKKDTSDPMTNFSFSNQTPNKTPLIPLSKPDSVKPASVNQAATNKADIQSITTKADSTSSAFSFSLLSLGGTEQKEGTMSQTQPTSTFGSFFSSGNKPTTSPFSFNIQNSIFSSTNSSTPSLFGNTGITKPTTTTAPLFSINQTTTSTLPSSSSVMPASTALTTATASVPVSSQTVIAPSSKDQSGQESKTNAEESLSQLTVSAVTSTTTNDVSSTTLSSPTICSAQTLTTTGTSSVPSTSSTAVTPPKASLPSATTTSTSLFGSQGINFGAALATSLNFNSSSSPSVFGGSAVTTSAAGFSSPLVTTSTTSIFAPSTVTASNFSTPSTTASTGSLFGGPATSSTESVFGTPSSSTTPFGKSTTPSFGVPAATTTGSSIFGAQSPSSLSFATLTTTQNAFGSPATTTSSIFGSPTAFGTPTTTQSIFGTPTTSAFGMQPASPFGTPTTSTFGTPTTSATSFFGQAICSPNTTTSSSVFGGSVFGQPAAASGTSVFGGAPSFGGKPSFGQPSGNLFGQTANAGNFGTSGGSMFGGSSSFGSGAQQQSNLFQSQGGSIFGGSFSGGGQSVSQTGFGSSPSFQNKPGSGGSVFGSQATFGSSPTFGGSATFGSPNKVFGSPTQPASFGSPQQSSTFETLANQNTMTFGNLAQSQQSAFGSTFGGNQPQQPPPPPQTPQFGGSSFSTWR